MGKEGNTYKVRMTQTHITEGNISPLRVDFSPEPIWMQGVSTSPVDDSAAMSLE